MQVSTVLLKRAVSRIQSGVLAKWPKEALQCVKLSLNGSLAIGATDLDSVTLERVKALEPNPSLQEICVNAKMLKQAIAGCKSDFTDITVADGVLAIGEYSTILAGCENDNFPTLNFGQRGKQLSELAISASKLASMLGYCQPACDTESTRYALAGVCLEVCTDRSLRAIATDARRLHAVGNLETDCNYHAIIPYAICSRLVAMAKYADNVAIRYFSGALVTDAKTGDQTWLDETVYAGFTFYKNDEIVGVLETRVLEGRYPNWKQVVPRNTTMVLQFDTSDFSALLGRACELGKPANAKDERTADGVFSSSNDVLTLTANQPDRGNVEGSIDCVTKLEGCWADRLDCNYVRDALKVGRVCGVSKSDGSSVLFSLFNDGLDFTAVIGTLKAPKPKPVKE